MFSCWTKRKTKKQLSLSQRGDNNGRQDQSNIRIRQQTRRRRKKKKKPRSGQTQSIQRTKNGRQTAFERIVESGKALINFIGVTASILMTLKIERRLRCSIFSLWRYLIKKESPIFISSCFVLFNRQPCIFFFILLTPNQYARFKMLCKYKWTKINYNKKRLNNTKKIQIYIGSLTQC